MLLCRLAADAAYCTDAGQQLLVQMAVVRLHQHTAIVSTPIVLRPETRASQQPKRSELRKSNGEQTANLYTRGRGDDNAANRHAAIYIHANMVAPVNYTARRRRAMQKCTQTYAELLLLFRAGAV